MKANKVKVFLLVLTIILAGFGREFVMKNINWVIKHLTQGSPNFSQSIFDPFLQWKVNDLILLKWGLTLVFTLLFYSLTYLLIKSIFSQNKAYLMYVSLFYATLIGSSLLLYVVGYAFDAVNAVYPTVRTIMGITQSFIPFIILYLFFKFYPVQNAE